MSTPQSKPPTSLAIRIQSFANAVLDPTNFEGMDAEAIRIKIFNKLTFIGVEWLEDMKAQDARPPTHGIEAAARERARQIQKEGYTPDHDNAHRNGELADAAKGYLASYAWVTNCGTLPPHWPPFWPWDPTAWKPSPDPRRNLEKAMALLAAEWDRLERLNPTPESLS